MREVFEDVRGLGGVVVLELHCGAARAIDLDDAASRCTALRPRCGCDRLRRRPRLHPSESPGSSSSLQPALSSISARHARVTTVASAPTTRGVRRLVANVTPYYPRPLRREQAIAEPGRAAPLPANVSCANHLSTMPNMRELVADLEARRAKIREMGGADKDREAARAREADRARAARGASSTTASSSRSARTARRWGSPPGRTEPTSPPPTASSRLRQGRRAHGLLRGLRLHRQGRQHRLHRRGEGHAPSRRWRSAGAGRSCGSSTRAARASTRAPATRDMISLFAGSGHLFREQVHHERRRPAGRGDGRPGRRGHGVHPGPRRLRADGEGRRLASRSAGPRS